MGEDVKRHSDEVIAAQLRAANVMTHRAGEDWHFPAARRYALGLAIWRFEQTYASVRVPAPQPEAKHGNNIPNSAHVPGQYGVAGWVEIFRAFIKSLSYQSSLGIGRRLVVVLSVYIDDSGTHSDSRIVVAAGYISYVDFWETFTASWQQALADVNVPPNEHGIRVFHMTDFENSDLDPHSPFYQWTPDQKAAFMSQLTGLIRQYTLCGALTGIIVSDYQAALPRLPLDLKPFTFAVTQTMQQFEAWANRQGGNRESILYFFDKVQKHAGELGELMAEVDDSLDLTQRFRFARWVWSSKAKDSPLQASDILAYEAWKEGVNFILARTTRPVRKALRALWPTIHFYTLYDAATLEEWIAVVRQGAEDEYEWLLRQKKGT